jgi:hypothetical protein
VGVARRTVWYAEPVNDPSQTPTADHPLITVGWREPVALPSWGVTRIKAKLDTGARTSAVHVAHIDDLGGDRIRFQVVTREQPKRRSVWVESDVARWSSVKPSSGEPQRRPVVRTVMRLGDIEREIEVSLVCREGMLCRMLIGRTALAGVFQVDPSQIRLTDPRRKLKPNIEARSTEGPSA